MFFNCLPEMYRKIFVTTSKERIHLDLLNGKRLNEEKTKKNDNEPVPPPQLIITALIIIALICGTSRQRIKTLYNYELV